MGKIALNQPLNWTGQRPRLVFALATLISLQTVGMTTACAETGSDLVISKDGGNVNVNLNTATSSDVSIRRSDDIMVIHVPKSYKGGLSIDPSLKKNSLVQETETPTGKAITIQSQQIYLHTFEGEAGSGPQLPSSPAKADNKPADSSGKTEPRNVSGNAPGNAKVLLSPADSGVEVKPGLTPRKANAEKLNESTSAINPDSLERLLNQRALFSAPRMDDDATPNKAQPASRALPEKGQKSEKQGQQGQTAAQNALPKPAPESATSTASDPKPTKSDANLEALPIASDPEAEPLEADSKRQAAAIQASIGGLLRIFFSLGIVLALAVAFMKVLLPKLMARYPDFFERLRESRPWTAERGPDPFAGWPRAVSTPVTPLGPPGVKPPSAKGFQPNISTVSSASASLSQTSGTTTTPTLGISGKMQAPPSASRREPSKKNYLERLQVGGDYFQVLQTTELGKGKELHLVELKGKQFLMATTPYTVTLLKDLSDEPDSTPQLPFPTTGPGLSGSVFPAPKPRLGPPPVSNAQHPGDAAPSSSTLPGPEQPERLPLQSETIAYLSDATPIRRVTSAKPYASTPTRAQQPVHGKPPIPNFPAQPQSQLQAAYQPAQPKFYADASDTPSISGLSNASRRPAAPSASISQPTTGHAYVDAEEVVVLEDYDDLYRQ